MIILARILLTAVIIFSTITAGLMVANIFTDFNIKWLDKITEYVIGIYLKVVGAFIAALFIAAVALVIYAIWTQM